MSDSADYWGQAQTPVPGASSSAAAVDVSPAIREGRVWARWIAKFLDMFVFLTVGSGIVFSVQLISGTGSPGALQAAGVPAFASGLIIMLVVLVVAVLAEAVLISAFGSTPGKWLMGIRIRSNSDDRRIGIAASLLRSAGSIVVGCGLCIPIVGAVCQFGFFRAYKRNATVPWDGWTGVVLVSKPVGKVRFGGALALALAIEAFLVMTSAVHPIFDALRLGMLLVFTFVPETIIGAVINLPSLFPGWPGAP